MAAPMSRYRSFPVADTKVERSTQDQSDFATSLRLLLSGYLDESLTVSNSADLVGMSERTLQRRLAAQSGDHPLAAPTSCKVLRLQRSRQ